MLHIRPLAKKDNRAFWKERASQSQSQNAKQTHSMTRLHFSTGYVHTLPAGILSAADVKQLGGLGFYRPKLEYMKGILHSLTARREVHATAACDLQEVRKRMEDGMLSSSEYAELCEMDNYWTSQVDTEEELFVSCHEWSLSDDEDVIKEAMEACKNCDGKPLALPNFYTFQGNPEGLAKLALHVSGEEPVDEDRATFVLACVVYRQLLELDKDKLLEVWYEE